MLKLFLVFLSWLCVSGQEGNVFTSEGVATAGNYTVIQVHHFQPMRIVLHSLTGDADVYVGYKPNVSFQLHDHNGSSTSCGLDFLDIPASPRPVFIAIYGHPSHNTSDFHLLIHFGKNSSYSVGEFAITTDQIYDWDMIRAISFSEDPGDGNEDAPYHFLIDLLIEVMGILLSII